MMKLLISNKVIPYNLKGTLKDWIANSWSRTVSLLLLSLKLFGMISYFERIILSCGDATRTLINVCGICCGKSLNYLAHVRKICCIYTKSVLKYKTRGLDHWPKKTTDMITKNYHEDSFEVEYIFSFTGTGTERSERGYSLNVPYSSFLYDEWTTTVSL